jgi:hypothetical protein
MIKGAEAFDLCLFQPSSIGGCCLQVSNVNKAKCTYERNSPLASRWLQFPGRSLLPNEGDTFLVGFLHLKLYIG